MPAAPGVAWGPLWRPTRAPVEAARVATARATARAALAGDAPLVEVHRLLVDDPVLINAVNEHILSGETAERALAAASGALLDAALPGRAPASEEARAVLARLMASLPPPQPPPLPAVPVVLALLHPDPQQVLALQRVDRLLGVALAGGSPRSHTALLAAQLGVPASTGLGAGLAAVPAGVAVRLDGDAGTLTLDAAEAPPRPRWSAPVPGFAVRVAIAAPEQVEDAIAVGAEGVGLLRTCAAWTPAGAPDRAAWEARLGAAAAALGDRPLVVRTFDRAPGRRERGPALLEAPQTRALMEAAAAVGATVVVPAVSSPDEVRAARRAVRGGTPVGVMLETPLAVWRADALLAQADLALVGSNDLVHLLSGVDRDAAPTAGLRDAGAALDDVYARLAGAATRAGRPVFAAGADATRPETARALRALGYAGVVVPPRAVASVRSALVPGLLDMPPGEP